MDKNTILLWVLTGAGSLVAVALAWVAIKYRSWIATKVKNDKVAGMLARLGDFVFRVVSELNQTVVAQLKTDGKWNAEEAAKVKKLALDKVKSYLGAEGVKEAMAILGLNNETLEKLITSFIETQVLKLKKPEAASASEA